MRLQRGLADIWCLRLRDNPMQRPNQLKGFMHEVDTIYHIFSGYDTLNLLYVVKVIILAIVSLCFVLVHV